MEKRKTYGLLIIGAILLIAGIIFSVIAHNTSYQESVTIGKSLTEVKEQIKSIEAGDMEGDIDRLKLTQADLSAEKLNKEKPYSYGLALIFLAILLTLKGIYNALFGTVVAKKTDVNRLAQASLLAALCFIGFFFFKIDIPIGTSGKTAFHFGNVFCVLAALMLGGFWGGLAGAVGMTIGDFATAYVTSAPKTFLLKLCIGLIVGFVAHKIFKLSQDHDAKYVTKATIVSAICGMLFNLVADPLVGYFYKTYLLGVPQDLAATMAKIGTITTAVNAVLAIVFASIFYLALRPALKKAGLFVQC